MSCNLRFAAWFAASPAKPEAVVVVAIVVAATAAVVDAAVVVVVVTLAALEDAVRPPEEAPNAPQMLEGATEVAAVMEADEDIVDDPFPPVPPFKLAAREASPLSAAVLALEAGRDLLAS